MYCIIVKNTVILSERDRYIKIMEENARRSVRDESDCLTFDIIEDIESVGSFYLYEVYKNEEALANHKTTPHYLESRQKLSELSISVSVTRTNVININR